MEHLDLAGVLNTNINWSLSSFDQQDAVYLSSSRQMLEPILEETSEDEERAQNSWNQYEETTSFWSSTESETGSVIRVEVTKDVDSISERDFACPAKRPRRSEEFLIGGALNSTAMQQTSATQMPNLALDDSAVLLRRYQRYVLPDDKCNSLEKFLSYEAPARDSCGQVQRSSTGSRRFDDFYSDSDSTSYHSLSRSSSLIQFESLERQLLLQEQHVSMNSLGNSSPSLSSCEPVVSQDEINRSGGNSGSNSGNNSRRGSQSSLLKRFESSEGRLHQTYYDLNKLNFEDETTLSAQALFRSASTSKPDLMAAVARTAEVKSDSESSSSSSSSSCSAHSVLTNSTRQSEDLSATENLSFSATAKNRIAVFHKAKNSVENLSEDSGYCEPSNLRRTKSKSIPQNFEKFCEEDEEFQQFGEHLCENPNNSQNRQLHSKNSIMYSVNPNDICQPKINTNITASEAAAFVLEGIHQSEAAALSTSDKNSLCMIQTPQTPEHTTTIEHLRSMAHSPSPVSSVTSTRSSNTSSSETSSSTCASTASFAWIPNQKEHKRETFTDKQNSLSDITDACSSSEYSSSSNKFSNGYVLEPTKPQKVAAIETSKHLHTSLELTSSSTSASSSSSSSSCSEHIELSTSDAESSPELCKRNVRIASEPNELHKIGRRSRKHFNKFKNHYNNSNSDDDSENYDDFYADQCPTIRRSCSWSERLRQRSNQTQFGDKETELKGYMNASYQNLTLLDYNCENAQENLGDNLKRSSDCAAIKMEKTKSSLGDYEGLICKGNFLLDELSEIFDKNASILNDKKADEEVEVAVKELVEADQEEDEVFVTTINKPKPPPRTHRNNSSSYGEDVLDAAEAPIVQHVQLVLRKPPARQKRKTEATSSLTDEHEQFASNPMTFSSFGKTFDQDPTNLRTSYAQSLEKCNFDAKELSYSKITPTRSIPKRRFHSQANTAKQRSLVSSTPNLNAFDARSEELEDDIYVSSAHTSMHQLPQAINPKPLGILLPSGSRTSFGKEVSFCPVVSKYSWQEQSSEECNEPRSTDPTEAENENDQGGSDAPQREEEESDDELLDNADATVIHNTRENELIAMRYAQEQLAKEKQEQQQTKSYTEEKPQETISEESQQQEHKTSHNNETQAQSATTNSTAQQEALRHIAVVSLKPTIVETTSSASNAQPSNKITLNTTAGKSTNRPLSIQLPILSEPPTNRAHNILFASQQLLDNIQERECEERRHLSESVQNICSGSETKMSKCLKNNSSEIQGDGVVNNNVVKSHQKFKADEKHPNSKGFLSRFANNLRFSLRRNKNKKQLKSQKDAQPPQVTELPAPVLQQQRPPPNGTKTKGKHEKSPDFIYIPLKGPLPAGSRTTTTNGAGNSESFNSNNDSLKFGAKPNGNSTFNEQQQQQQHVSPKVTGKPPKPPTSNSLFYTQQQRSPPLSGSNQNNNNKRAAAAHAHRSQSQFYTDTDFFLQAERNSDYYDDFKNQLNGGMQTSNSGAAGAAATNLEYSSSPSRASVSQKTQMFNNMSQVVPMSPQCKIGLIETNLDTHETVISGKTRSLMDIGPNRGGIGKRLNLTTAAGHRDAENEDDYDDDENDVYVEDAIVGSVRVKHATMGAGGGGVAQSGAQIASVRRPHKSMEFLLDKENQKNVLPPENELQKSHEQNPVHLSEHQLRIQASLQRLNIPDWFRQYNQTSGRSPDGAYKPGNFTRKRTNESGRWAGLNSKTTSLSSLGSQRSDRSPLLLSPSAHSHHGGQTNAAAAPHYHHHHQHHTAGGAAGTGHVAFSRWSTSQLNSTQTSPSASQRTSFSRGGPVNSSFMSVNSGNSNVLRSSYRQPYLGWRSQERLSQRTPHERLALSLLNQQQANSPSTENKTLLANGGTAGKPQQAVTPEIQSSIKEVTSAIVHYCTNDQRSRSTSPNSR